MRGRLVLGMEGVVGVGVARKRWMTRTEALGCHKRTYQKYEEARHDDA